jgi:Rv3651-like, C-terminal domain/Rv3651-like, N-terminal
MADKWLLMETFGGEGHHEPSVIAVGRTVKRMVPLASVLGRGRYLEDFRELVARVAESGEPVRTRSHDGRRQMIGHPLTVTGHVHGVYAWLGDLDEDPPPRDPAGAWYFNLTNDTTVRSDDLFDLYGVAPENREYERRIAEMFGRLTTNSDEAAGLALLVRSRPGDEHQATWAVRREDNGQLRAANFACRVMAEPAEDGQEETIVRGITHDIGAAEQTPSAPPSMVLAQQVIAAEKQPGKHRAIINLRRLTLIRWVDDPMPGVAWQLDAENPPAIHPDDLPIAKEMSARLANQSRVEGVLRVRSVTGGWMPVAVCANLMLLDQHTTAALVTVSAHEAAPT